MKQLKEVKAGGFYLFTGESNANSCFIESLKEAKLFIRLTNRHLSKYVKIHEYLLNAESWMIIVRIRKQSIVQAEYKTKRAKSGKSTEFEKETWRVISEQVRLLLAEYVKKTNRIENRQGSKVKEPYKRYYFESVNEARLCINKMKKQELKLLQRNPKYRKIKTHYTIPQKIGKGSVFLCTKNINKSKKRFKSRKNNRIKSLSFRHLTLDLLANMIDSTVINHFITNPP